MTVTREINGSTVEIQLTDHELYLAFEEQQHTYDCYDCEDLIDGLSEEEVQECYGVSPGQFKALVDEMATEKRRNMDKYDMSWDYARDEAVRTVIDRFKRYAGHKTAACGG